MKMAQTIEAVEAAGIDSCFAEVDVLMFVVLNSDIHHTCVSVTLE